MIGDIRDYFIREDSGNSCDSWILLINFPLPHRASLPIANGLYLYRTVSLANSDCLDQGVSMKLHSRLVALLVFFSLLLTPLSVIAQTPPPPQAVEQFIKRIRDGLKLNDDQVNELRQVLSKHESKYLELRRR